MAGAGPPASGGAFGRVAALVAAFLGGCALLAGLGGWTATALGSDFAQYLPNPTLALSLLLLGAGGFCLAWGRERAVLHLGASLCLVNLLPGIGSLYGVEQNPWLAGLTNASWLVLLLLIFSGALWRTAGRLPHSAAEVQALRASRENEARLNEALEMAEAAHWEWNLATGEWFWSAQMFRHLGEPSGRVTPNYENLRARVHPDDRALLDAAMEQVRAGATGYDVELRIVRPDESIRTLQTAGKLVPGPYQQPARLLGVAIDITERKQAELALLAEERQQAAQTLAETQARSAAQLAEQEKTAAARIAKLQETIAEHEQFAQALLGGLRAPLRAVTRSVSLLEEHCASCDLKLVKRVKLGASALDLLVTDSLNYRQAIGQEFAGEPVDLQQLVANLLRSSPGFQPEEAAIEVAGPLPVVLGHAPALTQCFANLLEHAIRLAKPGIKPRIRIRAELPADKSAPAKSPAAPGAPPTSVWLCIEDDGVGLAPEVLPRVFELSAGAARDHEGANLGLAMVKKLVQRMGGQVGVESASGQGSRFWLELPRPQAPIS